jgi:GT2 family glycosyltransferase
VVQDTFANRAGTREDLSPAALGRRFDEGVRVDVARLQGFTPEACHQEIELPWTREAAGPAPAVSVIIPCYGQAEFLQLAIHSVAVQTFTDWELIVVDDGSPDGTAEEVRRLAAGLPGRRIRLLRQPNAGLANARNAAIRAARGRYVLPLDADDAIHPDHLARTVAALEADPGLDIASTDVAVFGARTGLWTMERPFVFTVERTLSETPIPYASLYRRTVWEKVGGYAASMSAGYEDWDFWVGAAERGCRATVVQEPLLLYREKAASMLTAARQHHRALRARLVLNHPAHFAPEHLAAAEAILAAAPLPPAKPATTPVEVDLATGAPLAPPAAPAAAPRGPVKIGFLLIGTGRYTAFFPPLRASLRAHLDIPGAEPHFFFFTDRDAPEAAAPDTTVLHVDHLPWPLITLLRYKVFLDHAEALQGMDYLYYLDVDCLAVDRIGPELLGRLVATSHPR